VLGGTPWSTLELVKLDSDLDALLTKAPALRGAHYGVVAIGTATGDVLYQHAATDEFQPASTFKLVVGSAAIEKLGPDFTFRTTLGLFPDESNALVLHMGGDPTFSHADLAAGVGALGSRTVGRFYIDAKAFDRRPYPNGWTWDDFAQDYAPNVSAATLDENVITLTVSPGSVVGGPAVVKSGDGRLPVGPTTVCSPANSLDDAFTSVAKTGAAASDDTIDVARTRLDCPEVIGSIPLGAASESIAAAVYDPVVSSWLAFGRALASDNVAKIPELAVADAPNDSAILAPAYTDAETSLWTHDSKPFSQLLGPRFWIPSDNLFAELLLKELGLVTGGAPGSTEKGIAFEKTWLQSIGIDTTTMTLADGCGMSQYDRITPRDLVTILQHDWNGPNRQLVLDSLPVGGARGTIEGIAGTAASGRVFAKTGSMMHVRGLAGYLATVRHGAVTFAFEVDDWNGDYPSLAALRAKVLSRIVSD
jgi:serine-type D-Ala-D-Ala carboxypeptidase/endopeptidase (penicillin-binding protein 4)